MTNRDWRLHPITRVAAGVLGIFTGACTLIAAYQSAAALLAGDWRFGALLLLFLPPAGWLARFFLVGAWTGEEPPVQFDD